MATTCDSVLFFVFSFWFLEVDITPHFPILIFIQVWLLKYVCIVNAASTYHLMILVFSADRFRTIYFFSSNISAVWLVFLHIPHFYSLLWCISFQMQVGFLVLLFCEWNISALSFDIIFMLSFLNNSSFAGVVSVSF